MAIRVDRDVFDPATGSHTGIQVEDDGTRPPPWQPRPFTTRAEYQTSEAMRLMAVPADVIRTIQPMQPQQLFPPTEGYDYTQLTIEDVLDTERWSPQIRSWVSGTARIPRRVDAMEDQWSGTLRGFVASPNPAG